MQMNLELEKLKILLVEDMPSVLRNQIRAFIEMGLKAVPDTCENVTDAITKLSQNKYDLVITDWNLPDGTGLEVIKNIRKKLADSETKIIVSTTVDEVENFIIAVQAGANDYIVKPWDNESVVKKLHLTFDIKS